MSANPRPSYHQTGRMLINLDVAATAYFQSGPLTELVVKMLGARSVGNDRCHLYFVQASHNASMKKKNMMLMSPTFPCAYIRRLPPSSQ